MENHKTVKHALFSPLAKEIASDLGLEMQLPNLEAFSLALREAARSDNRLFVVTSDSRGSGKLVPFADEFPEQIVEVGIAEQNLVGIAAGLASANHRVYAVSPACFLTARSLEQIKNDVAYSDNRVNLVGISAGVSYGALGSTHHSLHDLAATRAIHNLDIVVPADNFETTAAIKASLNYPRPIYLRFGKAAMYGLYSREAKFEIGKANLLRGGCDATIISTGEMTQQAVLASKLLESSGISAAVLSMHTVKPLDEGAILEAANKTSTIITLEEHMVHGGLGEACAGVLMEAGVSCKFKMMGIPHEYTVTGSQADIYFHYNLNMEGIAASIRSFLGVK